MMYRGITMIGKYLAALLVLSPLACSGKVSIDMDDHVPPTFRFQRNGDHVYYIPVFSVSEVDPANLNTQWSQQEKNNNIIWQIEPPIGHEREIENLPAITYGKTPSGFSQLIPKAGSPPPLVEGKTYEAGGPGVMVPRGVLRFTISNGKAVRVPIPGQL